MADTDKNHGTAVNDEGRKPPNWRPHDRGWREGDPKAGSVQPGGEDGAGKQVDDGPGVSGGGAHKPPPPAH